jgi:hypothetical protein
VLDVAHKHRLKRLNRFLGSGFFKPEIVMSLWLKWCAKRFSREGRLSIALDWTALPGNFICLMAAIPFSGRAIPIYFKIVSYGTLEKSQNSVEDHFVTQLIGLLPKEIRPIVLADRGFGRASLLLLLLSLQVGFCIRVKSDVWITLKNGRRVKLSQMKVRSNRIRWYESITYREDGLVSGVNLAVTQAEESDDPWFLITNLASGKEAVAYYQSRFQIEEFFKDAKHQLGISDTQTPRLIRVRRLLCIACLGYGLLTSVGQKLEECPRVQRALIGPSQQKVVSYIWLALKAIRHNLIGLNVWQAALSGLGP